MKLIFLMLFTLFLINSNAKEFTKIATNTPILFQDGSHKHWCPICGSKIKNFYKTSHSSTLQNGTKRQYCSINCLNKDHSLYGINLNSIQVIDAKREKTINAKKAFYVINSKIRGTMSQKSKLAFSNLNDAKNFILENEGEVVSFEKAFKEVNINIKSDDTYIKNIKLKKTYSKGKRVFNKMCKEEIDLSFYLEINELKASIIDDNLCGNLNENNLQALSLYLWDLKKEDNIEKINDKVEVHEHDKCPVCGMFVSKYPRWAAQIFYKNKDKPFSFDGVKDLMKFYFNSNKWGDYNLSQSKIDKILVTDYYSQKGILAKDAFFVIGSDVYGPMGHELIPFENLNDAKVFKKDHEATKIVAFKDILEKEVYKLDE